MRAGECFHDRVDHVAEVRGAEFAAVVLLAGQTEDPREPEIGRILEVGGKRGGFELLLDLFDSLGVGRRDQLMCLGDLPVRLGLRFRCVFEELGHLGAEGLAAAREQDAGRA